MTALYESNETDLRLVNRGKVRDVYALGDDVLVIVATDRISAFDVILPTPIPGKGEVLTQLSNVWFARTRDIVANHVLDPEPFANRPDKAHLQGRSVAVRKCEALPVEAIVRGYLTGSGLKDYQRSGRVCGIALPAGLVDGSRLPETIFAPSTKAEVGTHDENVSFDQIARPDRRRARRPGARRRRSRYTSSARRYALERGIIIADTKFEFGLFDGELILIDEALTPDSSRFWPVDGYEPGQRPAELRQAVRARLPRDARLGQDGARSRAARRHRRQDGREVPRSLAAARRAGLRGRGCTMGRLAFWGIVLLTVAGVAVGIWYYVRDDYPFQISQADIRGFGYRAETPKGSVAGYVTDPPAELAAWISAMEKDATDEPLRIDGVLTLFLADGRSLQFALDLNELRGAGRWVAPDGAETAPEGVHVGPALAWYLRGVAAGLLATPRDLTPPPARSAPPSSAPSLLPSASP